MNDNVNHPAHYEGSTSLECIDCMRLVFDDSPLSSYCLINAFKYLWRHRAKGGQEDVRKALWYLDKALELDPAIHYDSKYNTLRDLAENALKEYEACVKED